MTHSPCIVWISSGWTSATSRCWLIDSKHLMFVSIVAINSPWKVGSLQDNYNCHNIYWDPLIWLVENGHLIALTCISFFNEPGPYSWGAGHSEGHSRQNYFCDTVQCFYEEKMDSLRLLTVYLTLTPIFSRRKAKIDLHMAPKLTEVMPISCLLRSIQFPSPQNDAIIPERSPLAPVLVLYVFSRAPQ